MNDAKLEDQIRDAMSRMILSDIREAAERGINSVIENMLETYAEYRFDGIDGAGCYEGSTPICFVDEDTARELAWADLPQSFCGDLEQPFIRALMNVELEAAGEKLAATPSKEFSAAWDAARGI